MRRENLASGAANSHHCAKYRSAIVLSGQRDVGLGIVIGHITSSISTSRPVGLSQHRTTSCRRTNCLSPPCNTTSCRRTVSHCPATPPAAVELSLTALQHHQHFWRFGIGSSI
ncbi:hypothetical protein XENTR_v10020369 [Xenopus tropicalis]|nr:hypothetical protein XENTR_v10020369 [Xenopus tropicalis]